MSKQILIKLTRRYGSLGAGETALFDPHIADYLEKHDIGAREKSKAEAPAEEAAPASDTAEETKAPEAPPSDKMVGGDESEKKKGGFFNRKK